MKLQMIKYIILGTALFLFSMGTIGCNQRGNASNPPDGAGEVIKLKIGKMTCGSCAYSSKTALEKVEHVIEAEVSFKTKIGKVYIEKGKSVNVDDLIRAVEKIGYTAKIY